MMLRKRSVGASPRMDVSPRTVAVSSSPAPSDRDAHVAAQGHIPAFGASCPCAKCQGSTDSTLSNVAGVLAAIKLGWELRPDETLTDRHLVAREGQRHVVELIEEALSRV